MWMQIPGRSKRATLVGIVVASFLGLTCPGVVNPGAASAAQAASPPQTAESEIIFTGKLSCSLKRRVDLPFKGVITALGVHAGQRVAKGEILATYQLAPDQRLAIQTRLYPGTVIDMETRLLDMDRAKFPLETKQQELTKLVQKKMAPTQSLALLNHDLQSMETQKKAYLEKLEKARQMARDDQQVLSDLLGVSLKSGKVPDDVYLKSPIDGYIIMVNPEMREGAELPPTPGVFMVGVMDPMLLRAMAFEIEALQIKTGDVAEVTLDALPGQKFQAKVSRVSWSSVTTAPDQPAYYEVELKVPNPDMVLKEGLKARIVLHKTQ
jgi:multidrug efflux pump subunit AcrA (membrane-fusion protein)